MLEQIEKFTETGKSFVPKISVRKGGQIGFSHGAIKKFGLASKDFVVLYMSKDHSNVRAKIALRFTNNQEEEGAIKLVKRTGNYFVSGKSFFDRYGIDYKSVSGSYDTEWYPDEQAAVIKIAEKKESKNISQNPLD